ncbi:MAG: cyclic nucleotide-binding domain-containing protein, partial [Rhodospirillales bacterium]|nr:cyclic nucleotide-binding domain-containing protein [Rhodospirillales bacterium]
EGDQSDEVFVIRSGDVEILKKSDEDDEHILIAVCRVGEIIGEMGVIRNEPRSTSVRARGNVEALGMTGDEFLSAFNTGNDLTMKVLKMLCKRIADTNADLIAKQPLLTSAMASEIETIRILPESPEVGQWIGGQGIKIEKIPFKVGRRPFEKEATKIGDDYLSLHYSDSHHISINHFVIDVDPNGVLIVRDLKSHLGTMLNNERISRFDEFIEAPLKKGPNMVVAGGENSPFRFTILVEPK